MGIDLARFNELLDNELAVHNALMGDMLGDYVEFTTEMVDAFGGADEGEMVPSTEYGRTPTQGPGFAAGEVAFPMRTFQYAMGWTRKVLDNAKPYDLARKVSDSELAHRRRVLYELKRAIFTEANRTERDPVKKLNLTVRAFLNADSTAIPTSPSGNTFDGATHTHYKGTIALDDTNLKALVDNVLEHEHGADATGNGAQALRLTINAAEEETVLGLSRFSEYRTPDLVQIDASQNVTRQRVNPVNPYNRAIGLYAGVAEVWVKPWGLANYAVVHAPGARRKPLAYRQRASTAWQGLVRVGNIDTFPLLIDYLEAEFGIGAMERSAAAVLYIGGADYVTPTLTL